MARGQVKGCLGYVQFERPPGPPGAAADQEAGPVSQKLRAEAGQGQCGCHRRVAGAEGCGAEWHHQGVPTERQQTRQMARVR